MTEEHETIDPNKNIIVFVWKFLQILTNQLVSLQLKAIFLFFIFCIIKLVCLASCNPSIRNRITIFFLKWYAYTYFDSSWSNSTLCLFIEIFNSRRIKKKSSSSFLCVILQKIVCPNYIKFIWKSVKNKFRELKFISEVQHRVAVILLEWTTIIKNKVYYDLNIDE